MNRAKESISAFFSYAKHNILHAAAFEFCYNLLLFLVLWPLLEKLLELSVKVSSAPYLNQYNIGALLNPWSLLILAAFLFFSAYFIFVEINALIINYRNPQENLPFWKLAGLSFKESLKVFVPKNWGLLLLVLLIFPLQNSLFVTSLAQAVKVPGFILDFIKGDRVLLFLYTGLMFLFALVVFFGVFTFHEMSFRKTGFFQAFLNSCRLSLRHFVRTFLTLALVTGGLAVVLRLAELAGLMGIAFFYKQIMDMQTAQNMFASTYMYMSYAVHFVRYALVFIGSLAAVSSMYASYTGAEILPKRHGSIRLLRTVPALFLIFCICGVSVLQGLGQIKHKENISVTAHRGGAAYAPENTISALETSIAFQADYAEIDVQQLRDGTLILAHDTNFNRISGVDRNVWDMDYAQVQSFDAGSYYASEFTGEKYPTLKQALACCKDKLKLIIELKTTGHEKELEKRTIEAVRSYGMEDQVIFASMNPTILKKVKEIDASLTTQLISAVAFGSYRSMTFADILSIEATFVTPELLSGIHDLGKELFVWTVNDEETARKLVEMNVDNILTDNALMVDSCLVSSTGSAYADTISDYYITGYLNGWYTFGSMLENTSAFMRRR